MSASVFWKFESPEDLVAAASLLRAFGFRELEAYTPFEVRELEPIIGIRRTRVPTVALAAAITGIAVAYTIMWFTNAHDYPLDVGGRPLSSLPSDVPIIFETMVLFTGIATFLIALLRSDLVRLYRPIFALEGFDRVSDDRYWLGADEGEVDAETFERVCRELGEPTRAPRKSA